MTDAVYKILDGLKEQNRLEWCDKQCKQCYIYWRTPEEWGNLIYQYILNQGMINTVCTFYELTSGDNVQGEGNLPCQTTFRKILNFIIKIFQILLDWIKQFY